MMTPNMTYMLLVMVAQLWLSVRSVPALPRRYSFDQATFDHYTAKWREYHRQWIGIDENIRLCDSTAFRTTYPVCLGNELIPDPQHFHSNATHELCKQIVCVPALDGHAVTPSDTLDYFSPALDSSLDNSTLCPANGDSPWISSSTFSLDDGLPPLYNPLLPVKLVMQGRVLAMGPSVTALEDAEIIAWQVSPIKLQAVAGEKTFVPLSNEQAQSLESLRNVSCAARQHTDSSGSYLFNTLMPPSYGPPRHIMVQISAPGYETLLTRVYFDADRRLQQLTTLNGNEQTSGEFIPPQLMEGYNTNNELSERQFPGVIAKDPRVAKLQFVSEGQAGVGMVKGYFAVDFDFVLSPVRQPDPMDISAMPVVDINGVWSDPNSGKVLIEAHGSFFHAREIPHRRTWGAVSGYLMGNTIRGVSFRMSTVHEIHDSIDNGRLSSSLIATTTAYSTGVIIPSDPFSSGAFLTTEPKEATINWGGDEYTSLWSKMDKSLANGYRYVKLIVNRETGGFPGGSLVINEIIFFEGILAQAEYPTKPMKMTTPRYPPPQVVACSSFIEQAHHCFKAFDGDASANSSWITKPLGSRRQILSEPAWITLDLGVGRGVMPTGVKVVCDTAGATEGIANGCPRTFSVLVSQDNIKYDVVYAKDFLEYNNDYQLGGNMFYFSIDSVQGRISGQRCGSCEIGPKFICHLSSFDGTCNSHFCGADGRCAPPPPCALGRYLTVQYETYSSPSFICKLCAAGRYGDTQAQDAYCSGLCSPGYFCQEGSTNSTPQACGSVHVFCPAGSPFPIHAPSGRRTVRIVDGIEVAEGQGSLQTSTVPCSPGHYCSGGVQQPCPMGTYGDVESLSTASCSGQCHAGTYCPIQTISPLVCNKGFYCPDGREQLLCPAGRFGATTGLKDATCSGLCALGHYCPAGSVSELSVTCPAGRYGGQPGLTNNTCSGLCSEGYYCPIASQSATQYECGNRNVYCPVGSPAPVAVTPGFYTNGGVSASTHPLQIAAEPGFYALDGIRRPCPAGTWGNVTGLSGETERVYGVPVRSDRPTMSPSVHPSPVSPSAAPSTRAPSISQSPTVVSLSPSMNPTSQSPSLAPTTLSPSASPTFSPSVSHPPSYQPSSQPTSQPSDQPSSLPTQRLASTPSPSMQPSLPEDYVQMAFACNGFCNPGYYCPTNSTSPMQVPCSAGRYGATARLNQPFCTDVCPLGHYCPLASVAPIPCPPGVFGNVTGLTDSSCSTSCTNHVGCDRQAGLCEEGYFCPIASISSRQYQCGGSDKYCPRGSATPTDVSVGYYSVGSSNAFTRSYQRICEFGHFCVGGVSFPCPSGTFGDRQGLSTSQCSGTCPIGHYCPEGTIGATTFRCPAGRYGSTTGLQNSACSGECHAGYRCPEASVNPTQLPCAVAKVEFTDGATWQQMIDGTLSQASSDERYGNVYLDSFATIATKGPVGVVFHTIAEPNNVYCPVASSLPVVALPGFYTLGNNMTTRVEQVSCRKGSYCTGGVRYACPAGRYGNQDGESSSECSGKCAKGYYCLSGSTLVRQFLCPIGRYGSEEGLTTSACSGSCSKPLECPAGTTTKH